MKKVMVIIVNSKSGCRGVRRKDGGLFSGMSRICVGGKKSVYKCGE
jgi:hypothetical protein